MKITIQHQPKELLLQTVVLKKNLTNPDNLYLFRCPYCTNAIAQIQGNVQKITAGLVPTQDVPVIFACKHGGCHKLYVFQTINGDTKETRVELITADHLGAYYCWNCKSPIFQFNRDKYLRYPDFMPMDVPFTIPCRNSACPVSYKVVDVV